MRIKPLAVVATLCLMAPSCEQNPAPQAPAARATPGPGFAVTGPAQHDALMTYGASLEFVESVSAIDEQLLVRDGGRGQLVVGPWMSLAPEKGSTANSRSSLAQGRIIARGKLASGSDTVTTYWYVDSAASGWRSIWVSSTAANNFIVSTLAIHSHSGMATVATPRTRIIVFTLPVLGTGTCGFCIDKVTTWCRDSTFLRNVAPLIAAMPAWMPAEPVSGPHR